MTTPGAAQPGDARAEPYRVPLLMLGILVLGAVIPLLVARHYGALGIPRSDDWSYLVTEFRWLDGGGLSFNHWVSMSLVGQLVVAAPVVWLTGNDIAALQVTVTVIGSVGLLAVYFGARAAHIGSAPAALLTFTIAAGPLWAPLAVSFMTDVPTFTATMCATWFAIRAVRARPLARRWWWAAVVAGVIACTIRQYAIVTLLAILVAGWVTTRDDAKDRRKVVVAAAASGVALAAFLLWWGTIPDGRSLRPGLPNAHAFSVVFYQGAGFVRLAGLLLAPVLALTSPVARVADAWRRRPAFVGLIGLAGAVWLAVTATRSSASVFVGNYVVHNGALADIVLVGKRPDVFPSAVWTALLLGASLAGLALLVIGCDALANAWISLRAGTWADPVTVLLGLVVTGYVTAYVMAMLTGIQVYDRYLLPALPAIAMTLLRAPCARTVPRLERSKRRTARAYVGATVCFLVVACVGFAFAADSASFDGARWRAAEAVVARGWSRRDVNGGFEWRNFHRRDKRLADGSNPVCVTVHVNPEVRPDRVVAVVRSSAPTREDARLVAFRTGTPCPEPPTP